MVDCCLQHVDLSWGYSILCWLHGLPGWAENFTEPLIKEHLSNSWSPRLNRRINAPIPRSRGIFLVLSLAGLLDPVVVHGPLEDEHGTVLYPEADLCFQRGTY